MLHTGLGPDNAVSGFMTQVIACAVQLGGMPVPVGGGVTLVDALSGIVRDAGGELRTSTPAQRITVSSGRATGVALGDGDVVSANRAVIAGVTPTHLYGDLLRPPDTPAEVRDAAARYRYGRAGMQIHIAMDEPPRWKGPDAERLGRTAIVHVTPGLDGVSRAVNEAERGLLPAEATIVAGQPCAVDPTRAPDGKWIIWIQLQELPAGRVKGDAAGELDVGDGTWTEELREAYADRIVSRLGESIENLGSASLRRIALSPVDLEALNPNLVHGDIYAGAARSTRTCSGGRSPPRRGTAPRSRPSGTSARARTPARGSEPGPATSSRRSSRSRRSTGDSLQNFQDASEALPLDDLDGQCVVRRRRVGLRRRGLRRDRPLGDEAAGRRRGESRGATCGRAHRLELHPHGPVITPARESRASRGPPTPRSGSPRSARRSAGSRSTGRRASSC